MAVHCLYTHVLLIYFFFKILQDRRKRKKLIKIMTFILHLFEVTTHSKEWLKWQQNTHSERPLSFDVGIES